TLLNLSGCTPRAASGDVHAQEPDPQPLAAASGATTPSSSSAKFVKTAPNFRLLDHEGRSHALYRQKASKAVVLFSTGNGCPIVRKSYETLQTLRDEFAGQGIVFWLINANPQDDRPSVQAEVKEFHVGLPILMDSHQLVASSLGIRRTAEVIAISTADWSIFYRGA